MEKTTEKCTNEFISITQRTHVTIKRLLEAGNYTQAMKLLERCQGYAISLGQQIESTEGENLITVSFLEDYCEFVYQIYETICCFLPVDPIDIHNRLAIQLIRIGNSVKERN